MTAPRELDILLFEAGSWLVGVEARYDSQRCHGAVDSLNTSREQATGRRAVG